MNRWFNIRQITSMHWILLALVIAVLAIVFLKRGSRISVSEAQSQLRQGATVVDVRTVAEFESQHLPGAVNVPLQTLPQAIEQQFPDKNKVLLLHCRSGARSGMAKDILSRAGYRNVFNLGGYGRAQSIVQGK